MGARWALGAGVRECSAARVVAGKFGGIIGRARKEDRRAFGAFRYEDDRVQLHPVTHGEHHVAPDVIETIGDRLKHGGRLARQGGVLLRWSGLRHERHSNQQKPQDTYELHNSIANHDRMELLFEGSGNLHHHYPVLAVSVGGRATPKNTGVANRIGYLLISSTDWRKKTSFTLVACARDWEVRITPALGWPAQDRGGKVPPATRHSHDCGTDNSDYINANSKWK